MAKVLLSKLNPYFNTNEVIDFMIDNGYDTVVNNISGNNIEYEMCDLMVVFGDKTLWNRLRNTIKKPIIP